MRHRICGLSLQAAWPLPGLLPDDTPSPPDRWHVSLGATPLADPCGELVFRSDRELADAVEVWRPRAGVLQLAFGDGTAALVDAPARTIEVAWPAHQDFDDALTYLVGPVLGAAQRLLGREVLHASCVDVDGVALALLGPAGAGKSTLTAALVESGLPLVCEDVAALHFRTDDRALPAVFRGGTRVKLWEDSAAALRGAAAALPRLVPSSADWHKRFLDAGARMTPHDQTPLGTVVVLERRGDVEVPVLEEIAGPDRLLALIANAYAGSLLDAAGRAVQLARLGALAAAVPVRRLIFPDRFAALPATAAALLGSARGAKVGR